MSVFREYKIDTDGKYFEIEYSEKKTTYDIISEATFYKATGYKKKDIHDLQKSVYPTQANDYLLLESKGGTIPIDYKLVPLVKFLWKKGFTTLGLNQPDDYNAGFISIAPESPNTFQKLQELFKGFPIKVLDTKEKPPSPLTLKRLYNKGILPLENAGHFIALNVDDTMLEKVHNHFGLKPNTKKLPGNVIVEKNYFKLNKISRKR